MQKTLARLILLVASLTCACGGGSSPAAPTPSPPATPRAAVAVTALTVNAERDGSGFKYSVDITLQNTGTVPATVTDAVVRITRTDGTALQSTGSAESFFPSGLTVAPAASLSSRTLLFSDTNGATGYAQSISVTVTFQDGVGTDTATKTTQVPVPDVEYVALGTRGSLTISNSSEGTSQFANVALPWWYKFSGARSGQFLYVSVQNSTNSGCVTAQIFKGRTLYRESQSCGAFVIATASGTY